MDKLGYCVSQTCGDHTDHLVGEGRCEEATGWLNKIIGENLKNEDVRSYNELIYDELEYGTPKAQYEYLIELKKKEKEHNIMKAQLEMVKMNLKAINDTPSLECVHATTKAVYATLTK